ncbi:uncharacterized protein LOC106648042 [Trichogramma pretiosum]|uniref:uncharacterized protein LOC106648042 n=1 Tax=Trichogramma pretiosum TaxID=7493 RepID=UPI000C71C266|nr:uncharacterized protein LOC106648042 [Trichogramma pretiosum]
MHWDMELATIFETEPVSVLAEAGTMRRQYSSSLSSSSGGGGEPLIVVEESTLAEEEAADTLQYQQSDSPPRCLDPDSPGLNPYLLSPWREARKHSLPTPQCTSGITASQVRRLSERGGEGSGPSPREAAFLATLSQSTPPQPGGRRHSVVTISRVPPTLFGRNRRESIAAFPMGGAPRILAGRRDSSGLLSGPPSNSGSTHNLQLDMMDDIVDIKARKVRLKMWRTPSRERVCEVQPIENNGSTSGAAQRYTASQCRRYSDFGLATIPSDRSTRRRASEMPPRIPLGPPPPIPPRSGSSGIVCSNTDLISILSSLTSSATEIDRCGIDEEPKEPANGKSQPSTSTFKTIEQRRNRLKSNRSNSFDVSILHGCGDKQSATSASLAAATSSTSSSSSKNSSSTISASSWFAKRHQPMAKKQRSVCGESSAVPTTLSFKFEKSRVVKAVKESLSKVTSPTKDDAKHKVVWDGTSGTKVDAQLLGNAIEEFLRSGVGASGGGGGETPDAEKTVHSPTGRAPRSASGGTPTSRVAAWFATSPGSASTAPAATNSSGSVAGTPNNNNNSNNKDDQPEQSDQAGDASIRS